MSNSSPPPPSSEVEPVQPTIEDATEAVKAASNKVVDVDHFVTYPGSIWIRKLKTATGALKRTPLYLNPTKCTFECDVVGGIKQGDNGTQIVMSDVLPKSEGERYPVYFSPVDGKNKFVVDVKIHGKLTTISGSNLDELCNYYMQCDRDPGYKYCSSMSITKRFAMSTGAVSRTPVYIYDDPSLPLPLECDINPGVLSGKKNYTIHGNDGADLAAANAFGRQGFKGKIGLKNLFTATTFIITGTATALLALAHLDSAAQVVSEYIDNPFSIPKTAYSGRSNMEAYVNRRPKTGGSRRKLRTTRRNKKVKSRKNRKNRRT